MDSSKRYDGETLLDSEIDLKNIHLQSKRQKKLFLESCTSEQMRFWQNKIIDMKRESIEEQKRQVSIDKHDRVQRSRMFQKLFSTRQNLRVRLETSGID
jgi:hypothetical protein